MRNPGLIQTANAYKPTQEREESAEPDSIIAQNIYCVGLDNLNIFKPSHRHRQVDQIYVILSLTFSNTIFYMSTLYLPNAYYLSM